MEQKENKIAQLEAQVELLSNIIKDIQANHAKKCTRTVGILVSTLDLSVRTKNCLKNEDIITLGGVLSRTRMEHMNTPNFGRKSLDELDEALSRHGLYIPHTIDGYKRRTRAEYTKPWKP